MLDITHIISIVAVLTVMLFFGNLLLISLIYLKHKGSIIIKIIGYMLILVDYVSLVLVFLALLYDQNSDLLIPSMVILYGFGTVISFLLISLISKSIISPLQKAVKTNEQMSQGNLTIIIQTSNRNDEIGKLEKSQKNLHAFLNPIIASTSKFTELLMTTSEELASSSEQVNASSEELSAIAQQIARSSQEQSDNSNKALQELKDFNMEFTQKLQGIKDLSKIINEIQEQITILSLNASIEAARSGEYGRGFSVVADNIKQMAAQTKSSMIEIDNNVKDVVGTVNNTMDSLLHTFHKIAASATEHSAQSEEAGAATEEQTATMEEITSTAQSLAQISNELREISNKFSV